MQIKKIFVFLILLLATIALCILTNCSSSNADVQYIKTMGSGIIYDGYNDFPNNNIIANRNESGNYAFSAENLNQNGKKTANQKIE
jgi:ABC-type oligopeptide transport system substrate-binding subunit